MSGMNQLDKCKKCKRYTNTNEKMRTPGHKVIIGDFCLKFKWNLGRMKTWDQKLSGKKIVNFPKMTMVPKECFE